ncbi:MAG: reverse transcriptase family protein, partial [Cyanobacteria bacterium J06553_1]
MGKIDWNRLGPKERERQFRRVVLTAGRKWVGMKRRGGEPRPVNVAQEESRARDELRAQEEVEWETVAAAEASVRAKYREARQQRWRARLQKGATVGAMWDLVRGAGKGRGSGGRRGEGLKVGERVLMTARAKANAFVSMYAKVSRVRVPKGARLKARINSALRSPGPEPEDSAPITPAEVRRALDEMAQGKAAGPDGIPPELLKMLPDEALEVVRGMFEESLRSAVIPQVWREGVIVPLLKAGKDPSVMGSYRPVCLTSCLGKWLERVVANRIRWRLEDAGWLSECQAGFRKGRGVNDQLVRLSQAVWDGYQRREKTCLVLYDLERAFDRVWHDGLLLKLLGTGVCRTLMRWLQAWLSNRLYRVRVEGVWGRTKAFQAGLPQGSVLSPLLFLVYINDLVERLAGGGLGVSAFADDLAVWATGRGVEEGRRRVQWATDVVGEWCKEWLMTVSVDKCTTTLFSNDVRDREMLELKVSLNGRLLRREKNPCFLGVTFDVGFTFGKQVERVVEKAAAGTRVLRCLAGSDWGWGRKLLRTTYVALVRAVLLYGSAAWAPWVSGTLWAKLEGAQLAAARVVGGTLRSAPREAVLAEAGLCQLRKVAESLWVGELEKCLRAPRENPRSEWGTAVVPRRLVRRRDWRGQAEELLAEVLPGGLGRVGWVLGECPWREWRGVEWSLEGRKSTEEDGDREAALARLR